MILFTKFFAFSYSKRKITILINFNTIQKKSIIFKFIVRLLQGIDINKKPYLVSPLTNCSYFFIEISL